MPRRFRRAAHFNPRSPHGERRRRAFAGAGKRFLFQSTLPARGATAEYLSAIAHRSISIHAPRTGSDKSVHMCVFHLVNFNPRSPHGERRVYASNVATRNDFNPRSPHGERQLLVNASKSGVHISIHAPRTGSDKFPRCPWCGAEIFQSTLPARGATSEQYSPFPTTENISIHAPRTGSDGERAETQMDSAISIHAPRTGSDLGGAENAQRVSDFNPRSPHGERLRRRPAPCRRWTFQSTLPARGATRAVAGSYRPAYFNPRSPHGERHSIRDGTSADRRFQSTLPARGATD